MKAFCCTEKCKKKKSINALQKWSIHHCAVWLGLMLIMLSLQCLSFGIVWNWKLRNKIVFSWFFIMFVPSAFDLCFCFLVDGHFRQSSCYWEKTFAHVFTHSRQERMLVPDHNEVLIPAPGYCCALSTFSIKKKKGKATKENLTFTLKRPHTHTHLWRPGAGLR